MKYGIKNEKILTSEEVLAILHRSAVRYSEYADTTLLFLFREKKTEGYNFYEVRFGKHNFMHLAGMKSEMFNAVEFYEACLNGMVTQRHALRGETGKRCIPSWLFWSRCWIYETANVIKLEKKI